MTSFLDQKLQFKLLKMLAQGYPKPWSIELLIGTDGDKALQNLAYLEEHGLVNVDWNGARIDMTPASATITAKGLDYIADDGGLTAKLNVLTVKINQFTLWQLRDELKKILTSPKNRQR